MTLRGARRVVVKVGSSVLVEKGIGLDLVIFAKLAKEISRLQSNTHKVVLVSSGAIAAGMERLQIEKRPDSIPHFQASAAIGQPYLMKIYQDCFSTYHQKVAQVLLTSSAITITFRLWLPPWSMRICW
jgi:glutamate 5-kinase